MDRSDLGLQILRRLVEGVAKLGDFSSNLSFPWIAKRIRSALPGDLLAGNLCFGPGGFGAIDLGLGDHEYRSLRFEAVLITPLGLFLI